MAIAASSETNQPKENDDDASETSDGMPYLDIYLLPLIPSSFFMKMFMCTDGIR